MPSSTRFWVVGDELAGVINVRHHLTPHLEEIGGHIGYSVAPSWRCKGVATKMLRGALERCEQLGISHVLLTCNADNLASWRVIERCGGALEREAWSGQAQTVQRWYWVTR